MVKRYDRPPKRHDERPLAPRAFTVTLVHGTFARKARWTREDSALRRALKARWGEAVRVETLDWSGRNTQGAREAAARRLGAAIREAAETSPTADHFIVAHSHGGNIAFLACKDEAVKAKVAGIACLSTPFLFFNRSFTAGFFSLSFWILVFIASIVATVQLTMDWPELWQNLARGAAMLLPVVLFGLKAVFLPDGSSFDFNLPSLDPDKVLIVRSPGDEASGLLQLASFLQWLLLRPASRLLDLSNRFWSFFHKTRIGLTLYLGFFALAIAIVAVDANWPALGLTDVATTTQLAMAVVFGLATLLPMLLAGLIAPLRFFLLLPYGLDLPFRAFNLRVTAETSPPGAWTVHTVSPGNSMVSLDDTVIPRKGGGFLESMMHSEAYDHPEAIDRLCDWIAERRR